MDFNKVLCSAPGCGKNLAPLPPEAVWLPEMAAMRRANSGRPVEVADFVKFALCGKCGHLLRKEQVRVYRFIDTLARAEKQEARTLAFKPFAARFAPKAEPRQRDARQ